MGYYCVCVCVSIGEKAHLEMKNLPCTSAKTKNLESQIRNKSLQLRFVVSKESFAKKTRVFLCYTSICAFRSGSCFTIVWPASINSGFNGGGNVLKMYERSDISQTSNKQDQWGCYLEWSWGSNQRVRC